MNIARRLLYVKKLKKNLYEMEPDELKDHQDQRLEFQFETIRKTSPYYQKVLSGINGPTLEDFPNMNKSIMMENFDTISTAGLKKEELLKFVLHREKTAGMDLFKGEYSVGMSSGTSGNKGLTVLSSEEMALYSCLLWARNGIPSSVKKKRVLFALRINSPAFMEVKRFGLKLIYADYTNSPLKLIQLVNKEKLNILAGPPSLLSLMGAHISKLDHPVDCLISYAEVLTDHQKKDLEEKFKAPVIQIYQGSEGFIGTTCFEGKLHINEDTLLVELRNMGDSEGNAKKVVLTDLYRSTQPIIRYDLDDLIEVSTKRCRCGSCFRVIEKIHGRADDIFLLRGQDGEIRYLFPDYVRRAIIRSSEDILNYQAIQKSMDSIEIRLQMKEGIDEKDVRVEVQKNLEERAKSVQGDLGEVSFSSEPPSPNPRSHKMIRVVREFDQEDI